MAYDESDIPLQDQATGIREIQVRHNRQTEPNMPRVAAHDPKATEKAVHALVESFDDDNEVAELDFDSVVGPAFEERLRARHRINMQYMLRLAFAKTVRQILADRRRRRFS